MPLSRIASRCARLAMLATLAACPLPVGAQDAATIKIGEYTKNTSGTVSALESGDVACYLTLKDERGAKFDELANFEICTQQPSIMGKRVALTYALDRVMADECNGDPFCKKTRIVALVVGAKIVDAKADVKTR